MEPLRTAWRFNRSDWLVSPHFFETNGAFSIGFVNGRVLDAMVCNAERLKRTNKVKKTILPDRARQVERPMALSVTAANVRAKFLAIIAFLRLRDSKNSTRKKEEIFHLKLESIFTHITSMHAEVTRNIANGRNLPYGQLVSPPS